MNILCTLNLFDEDGDLIDEMVVRKSFAINVLREYGIEMDGLIEMQKSGSRVATVKHKLSASLYLCVHVMNEW